MRSFEGTAREVVAELEAPSIGDITVVNDGETAFEDLNLPWGVNTVTLVEYIQRQEAGEFQRRVVESLEGLKCVDEYRAFCSNAHTYIRRSGVIDFSVMGEGDAARAHTVMDALRNLPDPHDIRAKYVIPNPARLERMCGYLAIPLLLGGFAGGAIGGGEAADYLLNSHPYIAHVVTAVSAIIGTGLGLLTTLGVMAPVNLHMDKVRERTKITEEQVLTDKVKEYIAARK